MVVSQNSCNFAPMIYPDNFENKIGFNEIRKMLRERCLSPLGKEQVDKMAFSSDAEQVNEWLMQVREFRRLMEEVEDFPLQYFYDVRESILRIRVENTHLEEDELFDLRRSLATIAGMVKILNHSDEDDAHAEQEDGWRREKNYPYPALHRLSKAGFGHIVPIVRATSAQNKLHELGVKNNQKSYGNLIKKRDFYPIATTRHPIIWSLQKNDVSLPTDFR